MGVGVGVGSGAAAAVPACATEIVWLATVTVPVRGSAVFGPTVIATCPAPLPLDPATTATHDAWLAAVQPQPLIALTCMVAVPPVAVSVIELASTLNEHGAPSCVTST